MYGIDINFLNDRGDRPDDALVPATQLAPRYPARRLPMLVGLTVALCAFGGVGSYWMVLENQKDRLVARSSALDAQLSELLQKIDQVDTIKQQMVAVNAEIQALASVFERIRPWSAIVRDMQGRIPARAQIQTLIQTDPTEEGSAVGGIELAGNACSFNDVNDFLLTLKSSPFLVSDSIEITTASLGSQVPGRCPGEAATEESTELVSYTITGDIKSIPATALLLELNRQQESTGIAARIRALQATGAIE